jgi:hypothetical protein
MLDWFSGKIGYNASHLKLDCIARTSPGGVVAWSIEPKLKVESPSYDESVNIGRGAPTSGMITAAEKHGFECSTPCLDFSGNPTKWLQGHNAFGPSVSDLGSILREMVRRLPGELRPADADSPLLPAITRSRVDDTIVIELGSHARVHEWLETARTNTRSRSGRAEGPDVEEKHGGSQVSGDTVYWNKHSRRWTMKAYCKHCEMQKHPPQDRKLYNILREYTETQLRLELTLRTLELAPRGTLNEALVWVFMERIDVGVMKAGMCAEKSSPNLNYGEQFTLSQWLAGGEVRFILPKNTFYRHRRAIKAELGLDISMPYVKKTAQREVFDLAYLKAHEIPIPPDYLQGYLFKPGKCPEWGVS